MNIDKLIKELNKQAVMNIKNQNYKQAVEVIQGLNMVSKIKKKGEKKAQVQECRTSKRELEVAVLKAFVRAGRPLTGREVKGFMPFSPNSADKKVTCNTNTTANWKIRVNALLQEHKKNGIVVYDPFHMKWILTEKGHKYYARKC